METSLENEVKEVNQIKDTSEAQYWIPSYGLVAGVVNTIRGKSKILNPELITEYWNFLPALKTNVWVGYQGAATTAVVYIVKAGIEQLLK